MGREDPNVPGKEAAAPRSRRRERSTSAGIRDVAKLAGVSISTVSRVLNDFRAVDVEVRKRVNAAIRELQYVPHSAARALSRRHSHTLGIIIPTIQDSIFAAQVAALQMRATELGYSLLIALSNYDLDLELKACKDLVERGVEGVMLVGGWHREELYRILAARGVVHVNTSVFDAASPHPTIGFDNVAAAELATNHVVGLGHRRIGYMSGIRHDNDRATLRFAGFRKALEAASLAVNDDWTIECRSGIAAARQGFRRMMESKERPTALVCHNDVMAFGATLEADDMRVRIPGALSIVGFDDLEWASQIRPSLTTVRVAWAEMASLACDYLVDTLNGAAVPRSTPVETKLVVRDSTAALVGESTFPERHMGPSST